MLVGGRLLLVVGRSSRTQSRMTRLKDAVQIDQTQNGTGTGTGTAVVVVSRCVTVIAGQTRSAWLLAEDATQQSPGRFRCGGRSGGRRCGRLLLKLMKLASNGRRLNAATGRRGWRARLRAVAVIAARLQHQPTRRPSDTVAAAIHCRINYLKKQNKNKKKSNGRS